RADRAHNDNVVDRAKTLDASARALLGMAKAMLVAKEKGEDQVTAVERALGAFVFRSWKDHDPLLTALDVVRELHASGAKKLPPRAPMGFLRPIWRKVVKTNGTRKGDRLRRDWLSRPASA